MKNTDKIGFQISFLALVLLCTLALYGRPLPLSPEILSSIASGTPIQTEILDNKPFKSKFEKISYMFTPHASYTLRGLVVSLNHSDNWMDISHKNDPAQTVDLCVVWGKNIITNAYRTVTYDHGDWTCYYRWTGNATPPFDPESFSNNHLIPTTDTIAKLMTSVRVGDQVEIEGTLADYDSYDERNMQVGSRHTSLVRNDSGNGACEIIIVREMRILHAHMPWREPLMNVLWLLVFGAPIAGVYATRPSATRKIIEGTTYHAPDPRNPTDPRNYI